MSVVGFDFGNESCIVAVARQRGIDVVLNDESKRETPAIVCFGDKQRFIGTAGAASTMMNPKNSISQIKRLIGRQFSDPELQQDLKSLPFNVTEGPDGYPLIHVRYMDEAKTFTPTQVFGMMLSNLKEIAQKNLNAAVVDCCIGIPVYFTDLQRRAVLDAATIAGLHPLRLFHETTATALAYGIYKTDLPENDQLNVAFVDIGHASMQVCIAGFKKGQLKVLAHSFDRSLGGRDFDEVLFHHFAAKFKDEYKIDVFQNARACLRLRAACEKLKKVLSANPEAPLNIECLMDEKDVRGFIKRDEFEQLSLPILERVKGPLEKALAEADLTVENVHMVEVVGSGSRVPAINKILTDFFKKEPRRTMNASECVAKGCALQCAILSPTFKVRKFQVTESLPFSISFSWKGSGPDEHESEPDNRLSTVVFPKGNPIPSVKLLTFYKFGTFSVDVQYSDASVVQTPAKISTYTIGPFQTTKGEMAKVKVRARLNMHGIVSVDSATLVEGENVELPVSKESKGENTKMDTDEAPAGAAAPPTSNDTDANMQDAKASADTPGGENGIPEAGDKPVQMDPDTKRKTQTPTVASGISSLADHVVTLDEASNIEATMINIDLAEEANVTPVQPVRPPSISAEDLAKYFSTLVVALPGESSLTKAVFEVIANILDMEAIPNLATLNTLQENLSCIANSTDDNVPESTKNLHNEMGMLLVDMNHHLEVGRQRINRSEHKLARLTNLSNQKQKLTLAFTEQESRRVEDLKKHQTTTQRIAFLKTSIAQMEAELQTLLPQEISLSQQLKQTQSEQFQLYAQATTLDKEIKSLTLQKQYLEKDFIDGQQQLYKADLLWQEIRFKLLADKKLSKDIITTVSDSATKHAQACSTQSSPS